VGAGSDEWSEIQDPGERRKIQNKLAQRRFRKSDHMSQLSRQSSDRYSQETRFENRKRTQSVRQRTNVEREVPTRHQNQKRSIMATSSQDFLGEASR
jgi:hypothetical protein